MRSLDEHWIAYPEFIAGSLTGIEKLKLRWLGRPAVRFLDTIVPATDPLLAEQTLTSYGLTKNDYVLVVPGGGTAHHGATNAPEIVAAAASGIAESYPTLLVGVNAPAQANSRLQCAPRLPMATLLELIRNARLVVSNGGDTLLQVIACQRPCIAVPIAQDQPHRVDACVRQGLAVRAELDTESILRTTVSLLASETLQRTLQAKMQESGINDGLKTAVDAIAELLGISEANAAE
jgi:predicted glycosyltransferase